MNKGFTLIEVIAVVLLISLISLIITPIGRNIYNSARKEMVLATAERLVNATDTYMKNYEIQYGKPINNLNIEIKDNKIIGDVISISGKLPKKGTIYINDNKIAIVIYDDGTCAYKNYNDGVVTAFKKEESKCIYSEIFK